MTFKGHACASCRGLGWTPAGPNEWPRICPRCGGAGRYRTVALAKFLGVDRRELWRVDTLRAGRAVSAYVLDAIARRFPEALA